jgi:aspartate/methionine/tyrosine aminotransferase
MTEIEKYARAAASTARTPPNSPARHAAIEAENAARVAAEQFVKALEADRDDLRARLDALDALDRQEPVDHGMMGWAVSRWRDEVENRPLTNKNRRTLDDTWRQVIRRAGGDPDEIIGPDHDTLRAAAPEAAR